MSEYRNNMSEKQQTTFNHLSEDINHQLIINMRDINHTMRSLYEGKASQKRILIILSGVKKITQRDLTRRLGIQPGSASEILSKLENAGLILRTESETDRRTVDIALTDKGEELALEAAGQRKQRHVEMFSCLSESEKVNLLSLLEKINEDWKHRYGTVKECGFKRHAETEECRLCGNI